MKELRQLRGDIPDTLREFGGSGGRGQASGAADRSVGAGERSPVPRPECPWCEARPADPWAHLIAFHRTRLIAAVAYSKALSHGIDIGAARAAYNRTISTVRPGTYDRTSFRRRSA